MDFRYHCFVIRHASERVTVVPLELPEFTTHGPAVARATEDIELAVDDRITRAHPGRIGLFARTSPGTLLPIEIPALPVWGADETFTRTLKLTAVVSPAHKPFVEVRLPRLDLRLWLPAGGDLAARATEMIRAHALTLPETERLRVRAEGPETLEPLTVRARPVRLTSLKPRELHMDERPPSRPDDAVDDDAHEAKKVDSIDGDADDDDASDDRWEGEPGPPAKKPKRAAMPTLRRLGVALHEAARRGELMRAFERDELVDVILARLDGERPEPLVLVGPPGVGKTAILHEAFVRMSARDAPEPRRDRPVFHLDGSRWIAGEGFFGDWQASVIDVLAEAGKGRAVLHLGHIVDLLDAGKSAHSDQNVSQLIAPALTAREVTVLGEATVEEWTRIEQRNAGFARAWSVLRIEEPPREATERIVAQVAGALARAHEIALREGTVPAITALARRFWPYGSAVGNAVNLLRRFLDASAHARRTKLAPSDAVDHFSGESGIPRVLLRDDLPLDPARVHAFLAERVIGQPQAVTRATEVIAVIKAGLSDVRRPIGVLVFAGPTGVGKTELSKAIAEFVFGARDRLVRLDMGEYAGPDALARLLGEGGHAGALTAAVRRQPFSLVLLDEIEKGHPAVFDAMLGLLGEGRLTDATGHFTDFRNTVIVMTSNLGADTLRARVGFGAVDGTEDPDAVRRHYIAEAERFFRPELFNRIDDFIVFAPLGADALRRIVEREVARIAGREGLRRHQVVLDVTPDGFDRLAARGLDPRYGARPLKRTLERDLVVPIANHLADHPKSGATRITVSSPDERMILRAESIASGAAGTTGDAVRALLSRAGAARAEIRQWWRSRLVTDLRHRATYFEKASREPAFWRERGLAEDAAQRASTARDLLDRLADLGRHAESVEDLAFEAYYDRAETAAGSLADELDALDAQLAPLKIGVYASLFPPRASALLYLSGARGTLSWLHFLLKAYTTWAAANGLRTTAYTCRHLSEREREGTPKNSVAHAWRWVARMPEDRESPAPLGVALAVKGGPECLLLAGEHGVHRVQEGSTTALVRVRFEPRAADRAEALIPPEHLESSMPAAEIRKVSPSKRVVHDLRYRKDFAFAGDSLDLPSMLAAYVTLRVFGTEGDAWS